MITWVLFFLKLAFIVSLISTLFSYLIFYYEKSTRFFQHCHNPQHPYTPISSMTAFRAVFFETLALFITLLISWTFFFPLRFNTRIKKTPIIFVHGYLHNQSLWFFLSFLLKNTQHPLYGINLFYPFTSVKEHAEKLAKKIEKVKKTSPSKKVILVGHSMGGLVCSFYAHQLDQEKSVEGVVTLGTPWHGTKMTAFGWGKSMREMALNAPFVRELRKKRQSHPKIRHLDIGSSLDNIILPHESSFADPHDVESSFKIEDLGHVSLCLSIKCKNAIARFIQEQDK